MIQLKDDDYEIIEDGVWLEVNNMSIRIFVAPDGVEIDVYKRGDEMGEAVLSTKAYNSWVKD